MDPEQRKDIRNIIAQILEVEPDQVTPEARFTEDLEADSVAVLELISELENRYGIRVEAEQLPRIATFSQVIRLIDELKPHEQ